MEVTNISAQLFNKQLPPDERASYYGCNNDILTTNLTTCVPYISSDDQIEGTFQKQLDLSDYYKGNSVFEEIKKDFMDRVMGNENKPDELLFEIKEPPITSEAKKVVPVGPRDNLFKSIQKEFFGKGSSKNNGLMLIILALLIFVIIMILINIKK
jgi:hypothetical protein